MVVTGVNLLICEKGRDWFREMMGVKMGSRYVELPRLVIDDVVVAMVVVGIVVVWYWMVGGGVILVVTL